MIQTAGGDTRDPGVDAPAEGKAERSHAVAGSTTEDQGDAGERHCHQGVEH